MPVTEEIRAAKRMSDVAVQAKTGKTWPEWFALLDAAGATSMTHPQIVAYLREQGVGAWWQQAVTVAYEQERGLRARHQMADGYQIGGNKTIAVPVGAVFDAWGDETIRAQWLPDPLTIRKATPDRSLRITWSDGTSVDVMLTPKGEAKTQISLQHNKLRDAAQAEAMKAYWSAALTRLKALLETTAD